MNAKKTAILAKHRSMARRHNVQEYREQLFWARYTGPEDEADDACFWLMRGKN